MWVLVDGRSDEPFGPLLVAEAPREGGEEFSKGNLGPRKCQGNPVVCFKTCISWVRTMMEMFVRLEYRWQHAVIIGNLG